MMIDGILRTPEYLDPGWDGRMRRALYLRDDARYGRMWTERFGARLLEEVTAADLERVKAERAQLVEPATVNRELAFLKHVYNVAIRDSQTERNPVSKIKLLREPSGRVRYLTDEEEARLMAAFPTDADRQRVTILLQTGLRKSEFFGLRWKDVDLRAGVLTIPRSKNGETRHVPMTSNVRGIFSRLPRSLDSSSLAFPNSVGTPELRWAKKTFQAAVRTAEIDAASMTSDTPLPRGSPWRPWIFSRSRIWADGKVSRWYSGMLISPRRTAARRLSAS